MINVIDWKFIAKEYFSELSKLVWDNSEEFMKKFAQHSASGDLIGVWFNEHEIKFNYFVSSGQHFTDTITLDEFLEFLEEVNNAGFCERSKRI